MFSFAVVLYCLSSHGSRFSYYRPKCEEHVIGMADCVGEFGDTTDPLVQFDLFLNDPCLIECAQRFDCRHWFIAMEKKPVLFASMREKIDYYIWALGELVGRNARGSSSSSRFLNKQLPER
ncbi:hypothetical protein IFM89_026649 [Coptis chinensis]|uniref:Uncharacterized protein n=1 Tax=Coptis chinensis TaxID=261450 RepID=A0A835LFV2_9MAGN|nr:hypothetical protein IFM89_026649 [Coptis chinensis]